MSKFEIAKRIITENWKVADCGIFDCRNNAGDTMATLYHEGGLQIDICYYYAYFEVFGLTDDEFERLADYYDSLRGRKSLRYGR